MPSLGSCLGESNNALGVETFCRRLRRQLRQFAKRCMHPGPVFQHGMQTTKRMMALGFVSACVKTPISLLAPFDFICNTLEEKTVGWFRNSDLRG